jgi:hypothetical protein
MSFHEEIEITTPLGQALQEQHGKASGYHYLQWEYRWTPHTEGPFENFCGINCHIPRFEGHDEGEGEKDGSEKKDIHGSLPPPAQSTEYQISANMLIFHEDPRRPHDEQGTGQVGDKFPAPVSR